MTPGHDTYADHPGRATLTTIDIGVELWREYVYKDGFVYRIEDPLTLYSKHKPEGDSHRVLDRHGVTHYVPAGWRILRWNGETVA